MGATEPATVSIATPTDRRLAAVVFTDVVGYSAMMQADEASTIVGVRTDLAQLRAACEQHGGECLSMMGDGLMLAFPSAVEAVKFAVEAQQAFAARNRDARQSRPIRHRIGIHIGDVFRMPDGLLAGDGVNIAARLQTCAPEGGICMSQAVHDLAKGKLAFEAGFGGARALKNIAGDMPVWLVPEPGTALQFVREERAPQPRRRTMLVAAAGGAAVAGAGVAGAWLWWPRGGEAADPHSIAVLPFQNLSDDKDTSYFADGVHEDLLTQLALLGQLKVVSRTSVMEYRNSPKKLPQIGAELKVASLVEGSVRRAGNLVRVTAQLLDARTDKHLWAANYDRDLRDIFKVQTELATEIARQLDVSLSTQERTQLARSPTRNLEAWDLYLRHQAMVRDTAGSLRGVTSVKERTEVLERAVQLDPDFALAWAKLGAEHARLKGYEFDADGRALERAQSAMNRARHLAPDDLQVKIEDAAMHLHGLDDQAGARRLYEQVLARAPYNVDALNGLSEVLNEMGLTVQAVDVLERGLSVDARNGIIVARLAGTYGRYRRYDQVLELRRRLVELRPGDIDLQAALEQWKYWQTGSWESFDRWRASLPKGVENQSARVRNLDADRAIARRDFAEVDRLIEVDAKDWRHDLGGAPAIGMEIEHAVNRHAAGDHAQAQALAAAALPKIAAALAAKPDDSGLLREKTLAHALLRQGEAALSTFAAYTRSFEQSGNSYNIELKRRWEAHVHALLGDTAKAIALLRSHAQRPGFFPHDLRVSEELASLWPLPEFKALLGDPASNAPLPLQTPFGGAPAR